ncbi:Maf1 negative regulator of RNA polymerase [Helicosporidium sp. ATCC 50920]|nr:Maf1 negative regulator of RNA polymerase [Helicosporidium sp. ATCC 50920]|eukprot:KDD74276.1 Maf1 negative regulator of RNA polymerase [Helicosporidium sp. ATCC 50920]
MKYLDIATLSRFDSFLDNLDCGDVIIRGDLEAYSCKLDGIDKKLSRSLEEDVKESSSSLEMSKSPVGPLHEASSRQTLVYLILTLNHTYPDYDFSLLRAHHFSKESSLSDVEENVESRLVEVAKAWESTPGFGEESLFDCMWSTIDEVVTLKNCTVYSYKSDGESDPFGEKGSIWSFNYFFYNRKRKRIVYLSCRALSKTAVELSSVTDLARYNTDDNEEDAVTSSMANEMDL